jgi:hypothetical protein
MSTRRSVGMAQRATRTDVLAILDASIRHDNSASIAFHVAGALAFASLLVGRYLPQSELPAIASGALSLFAFIFFQISEWFRRRGAELRAHFERRVFDLSLLDQLAPLDELSDHLRTPEELPAKQLGSLSTWFKATEIIAAQQESFYFGAWSRWCWAAFLTLVVAAGLWIWWPSLVGSYGQGVVAFLSTLAFGVAAAGILLRPATMAVGYARTRRALLRQSEDALGAGADIGLLEMTLQLRSEASRDSRVIVPNWFYKTFVRGLAQRGWERHAARRKALPL